MVQRFSSDGRWPEYPAGIAVAADPALSAIPWSNVSIQADDSILLAGLDYQGAANSLAVGELTPDGSVDTAFGDSGMTGTVFQNDTNLEPPLFLETARTATSRPGATSTIPTRTLRGFIDAAHYLASGLPVTEEADQLYWDPHPRIGVPSPRVGLG